MIEVGRDFERIRDYLIGRLSDEERNAFEDRLARDPTLARELEQTLQLREGLTQLRDKGELVTHVPRIRSWQSWFPTLAAAAIAGLALYVLVNGGPTSSPVLMASVESATSAAAPAVTAHFTFMAMRGSSEPALDLPAQGFIEFRAAPANRAGGALYRATLLRLDARGAAQPVGDRAGLSLAPDGYVHLYADAARLAAGRYVLRIEEPPTDGPGTAEAFPFSLRAPATH